MNDEFHDRIERFFRSLEAKYSEYKMREATYRSRAPADGYKRKEAEHKADRELWKAHGMGVAIHLFNLHLIVPAGVDVPLPDTAAGELPDVEGLG